MRTRYAITHVNDDGIRVLTFPNQSRYHYDTRAEAEAALPLWKQPQGLPRVFVPEKLTTLEVTEIECYDHGDATATVLGWARACRWWHPGDEDPNICLVCEHHRAEHKEEAT